MELKLLIISILTVAISGVPALFLSRRSNRGQVVAALLSVLGSILGVAALISYLWHPQVQTLRVGWSLPGAAIHLGIDALSAIFLAPIFFVSACGSIFGLGYWPQSERPHNGLRLRLFYGLMTAGMATLVLARNSILFLVGWEIMAVSAFFLVATEDDQPETRRASWIYLAATHFGSLILITMFILMRQVNGHYDWIPLSPASLTWGAKSVLFVLGVIGFGLKAGIMPLHFWLPGAHAHAPSHVSALMSGVLIKMGIYGIMRLTSLLPDPEPWWGWLILGLGAASAMTGIAAALGQSDLKRMLAYSSIDNMGIVAMGIGLALLGRAYAMDALVTLGMSAALLHVINHSLFKPLLFYCSGAIVHAAGTRRMDLLGGLARSMPMTAAAFLTGAAAICAMPLSNGFVSEFIVYMGLFTMIQSPHRLLFVTGVLGTCALALTGALAVAGFVRAFGSIFLGTGRSDRARGAHEAPASMTGVSWGFGLACLILGVAPVLAAGTLDAGVAAWCGSPTHARPSILAVVSLPSLSLAAAALALTIGVAAAVFVFFGRRSQGTSAPVVTWDCGYANASSPRLQYTSSSLAATLTAIFPWAIRQRHRQTAIGTLFPEQTQFTVSSVEWLLARLIIPGYQRWARRATRLRFLQQGRIQIYLLYILLSFVFGLGLAMLDLWSSS